MLFLSDSCALEEAPLVNDSNEVIDISNQAFMIKEEETSIFTSSTQTYANYFQKPKTLKADTSSINQIIDKPKNKDAQTTLNKIENASLCQKCKQEFQSKEDQHQIKNKECELIINKTLQGEINITFEKSEPFTPLK